LIGAKGFGRRAKGDGPDKKEGNKKGMRGGGGQDLGYPANTCKGNGPGGKRKISKRKACSWWEEESKPEKKGCDFMVNSSIKMTGLLP